MPGGRYSTRRLLQGRSGTNASTRFRPVRCRCRTRQASGIPPALWGLGKAASSGTGAFHVTCKPHLIAQSHPLLATLASPDKLARAQRLSLIQPGVYRLLCECHPTPMAAQTQTATLPEKKIIKTCPRSWLLILTFTVLFHSSEVVVIVVQPRFPLLVIGSSSSFSSSC